jgi:FMN phosphatase YigB (HAD superfamily)
MEGVLPFPRALLLDFGGVLIESSPQPPAPPVLVRRLHTLTQQALSEEEIARDLANGAREYSRWRDEASHEQSPAELSPEGIWDDFVAVRWPRRAREAVRAEAASLSYEWTWHEDWVVRPGIAEALEAATAAGLPMVVVSNALSGAAHRDILATAGLGPRFAAQLYSDELGMRKPNPELAWRAASVVDVPIEGCWFVGDTINRDILCARRAGAGAAVLMRSTRTAREQAVPDTIPDVIIEDGYGLLDLLTPGAEQR